MQVKKLGKTLMLGQLSAIERKKVFSKIYTTMLLSIKSSSKLFEKYSSKSTFFSVQQSLKFEKINK